MQMVSDCGAKGFIQTSVMVANNNNNNNNGLHLYSAFQGTQECFTYVCEYKTEEKRKKYKYKAR